MTFAESLVYFAFVVQVASNVAVAFYVFPMWRERSLRFFPILGCSAILGAFTTVANWTWSRQPMSQADYYWFWCGVQVLGIVDLVLYSVGVVLMVRHFQSGRIGFDTDPIQDSESAPATKEQPTEHYLRLVFRDEQAAYYQFHLFPDLDAEYVLQASRKRTGAVQHVRITVSRPNVLQDFIESCRSNPHFIRVEESTPEEFHQAPSNAV
jgi:predicted ABC-type exoprotein transport system permease subunit